MSERVSQQNDDLAFFHPSFEAAAARALPEYPLRRCVLWCLKWRQYLLKMPAFLTSCKVR
jgi:hypothetical protein